MATDDATQYRPNGMTVWFDTDPTAIKSNPFDVVSEFGKAVTIGRGDSFSEADIYLDALEAIMDAEGFGPAFDIAEEAIDRVNNARNVRRPQPQENNNG